MSKKLVSLIEILEDRVLLDELTEKLSKKLKSISYVRDVDFDDAIQETYVQLWKSKDNSMEEIRSLEAWVWTIAKRIFFGMCKKQEVKRSQHERYVAMRSEKAWYVFESNLIVESFLESLSCAKQKAVLTLCLQDYNYRDIEDKTGISKTEVGRVVEQLRKKLRKFREEEGN